MVFIDEIKKVKNFVIKLKQVIYNLVFQITSRIRLVGFQGISVWEIITFFKKSIKEGLIGMRAGSIAFHFFMALIPFGLLMVVLISSLPNVHLENDIKPIVGALCMTSA